MGDWLNAGNKAKNRVSKKPYFYDHVEFGGKCAHDFVRETILVHQLKTPKRWNQVLNYFERHRITTKPAAVLLPLQAPTQPSDTDSCASPEWQIATTCRNGELRWNLVGTHNFTISDFLTLQTCDAVFIREQIALISSLEVLHMLHRSAVAGNTQNQPWASCPATTLHFHTEACNPHAYQIQTLPDVDEFRGWGCRGNNFVTEPVKQRDSYYRLPLID